MFMFVYVCFVFWSGNKKRNASLFHVDIIFPDLCVCISQVASRPSCRYDAGRASQNWTQQLGP